MAARTTTTYLLISLGALIVLSGISLFLWRPRDDQALVRSARQALKIRQFDEAEKLATRVPKAAPLFTDAMLIAGEAATRREDLKGAVQYYEQVSDGRSEQGRLARVSLANVLIHTGDIERAITTFRAVLADEPNDVSSHQRIAYLFAATAQRWSSRHHLETILKSGASSVDDLALLADLQRPVDEAEYLNKCHLSYPDDPNTRLGLAAIRLLNGEQSAAQKEVERIVREFPENLSAQSLLGELLAGTSDSVFDAWNSGLPSNAESWPDIWYDRGLHCYLKENRQSAARCFWEVLKLAPLHRRATYQLGRVLTELERPEAPAFAERARDLFTLSTWLMHATRSEGRNETALREIVGLMDRMGRVWETCAWSQLARQNFPDSDWPDSYLRRLGPRLNRNLPMILSESDLAQTIDLSSYAPYSAADGENKQSMILPKTEHQRLTFVEQPDGPDFVFFSAADPATRGARMQEQTGGGIGVLDADQDGLPDLYCVQSAEWPSSLQYPTISLDRVDRLYRNRGSNGFADITAESGIQETGFSQSCAIGDLDQDGFEDLYVANIGPNSLLLSNGDGTFSVKETPTADVLQWTSSCAMVDVNRDGNVDLIDINYVSGSEVYSRICSGRACSPSTFGGTLPQIHLGRGDGTFDSVLASVPVAESKGLGLLVFQNPDQSFPYLFIANDQTPKFLLSAEKTDTGYSFHDSAFRTGLAYNGDGLLTAAMGIAAEDLDQNGLTDFFITNFMDEANTLYLQQSSELFQDLSRPAGVAGSGLPYVGWGTQFFDPDNDGDSDIVIANGHVDDYTDEGGLYHMPPQLLRNLGPNEFEIVDGNEAGPFFMRKLLGRGLSLLDWNDDGRQDFVVSCIGDRAALVTNTTANAGHFLKVRLIGVHSERCAWFSNVEVSAGDITLRKQLYAGSGYHASNERILMFGIGEHRQVDQVRIKWPGGSESLLENVQADSTLEIREATDAAILRVGRKIQTHSVIWRAKSDK